MKPSASLDNWRDFFRGGDSDIFEIIHHAILVAATDEPKEFKSRRGEIAELLFSSGVSHCIGCDHLDISIAGDKEVNHGLNTKETVGVGHRDDEDEKNKNHSVRNRTYGEPERLSDEFGQNGSVIADEVMRIRDILLNKEKETDSMLLKSLRKLESMSMTVDILKETQIGKAVNGLRKHSSDKISKLAKTLFVEWKELFERWMKTPKEMAVAEGTTPESVNLSTIDHEDAFPSPPHDLDMLPHEPNGFELSQILNGLDCDGNPRHNVETKQERKLQSSSMQSPDCTNEAEDLLDLTAEIENLVEEQNKNQHKSREEAKIRPMRLSATGFDDPRRQPKQMVHADQRKPLSVSEQKQKLIEPQQDKLKDPEAKFEIAKRKLQESYQQHDNAKKRRTIQVLDTIPQQSKVQKVQKPQFKRPTRR